MLAYTVERIKRARLVDHVVIATSVETSDDPVEEFCKKYGVDCHRGPLENIAQRLLQVIEKYHLDAFVRICADSPFVDQQIIDQAVKLFRGGDYDMVTNTLVRSFPKGQSVEVVGAKVFREAYKNFSAPGDFEHVTSYFHAHPSQFKIHNFSAPVDNNAVQLSVDTPKDFEMAKRILESMDRPHFEYGFGDILKIYSRIAAV